MNKHIAKIINRSPVKLSDQEIAKTAAPAKKPRSSLFTMRARLSLQEQALFAKRLSLLVKAGVPLLKSLRIMETQARTRANRNMFERMSHDVANGQYLSKSMARFRKVFGDFTINIIHVGETSGTLSENLKYLADEIDKKRRLRAKVVGALVYPLVIMVGSFGISGLMTVYLFPKLLPVFKSLNVDLPLVTRILLHVSDFLLNYWLWLFVGIILFVIGFSQMLRIQKFRYMVNKATLYIPVVGQLLMYYHVINLCRTLGILFKSNVRVLEALTITGRTCTSLVYRKELNDLHHAMAKGGHMYKYLEKRPKLFPPMIAQMVEVGETTGSLSDTLLYLGSMYEEELDEQTKRLSSVIEPIMMIFMGILVGFIAVSIITPIYAVTQHLNPR